MVYFGQSHFRSVKRGLSSRDRVRILLLPALLAVIGGTYWILNQKKPHKIPDSIAGQLPVDATVGIETTGAGNTPRPGATSAVDVIEVTTPDNLFADPEPFELDLERLGYVQDHTRFLGEAEREGMVYLFHSVACLEWSDGSVPPENVPDWKEMASNPALTDECRGTRFSVILTTLGEPERIPLGENPSGVYEAWSSFGYDRNRHMYRVVFAERDGPVESGTEVRVVGDFLRFFRYQTRGDSQRGSVTGSVPELVALRLEPFETTLDFGTTPGWPLFVVFGVGGLAVLIVVLLSGGKPTERKRPGRGARHRGGDTDGERRGSLPASTP